MFQAWEQTAEFSHHGLQLHLFTGVAQLTERQLGIAGGQVGMHVRMKPTKKKENKCFFRNPCVCHHQVGIVLTCPGQLHPSL